jgi:hypothetical protein
MQALPLRRIAIGFTPTGLEFAGHVALIGFDHLIAVRALRRETHSAGALQLLDAGKSLGRREGRIARGAIDESRLDDVFRPVRHGSDGRTGLPVFPPGGGQFRFARPQRLHVLRAELGDVEAGRALRDDAAFPG